MDVFFFPGPNGNLADLGIPPLLYPRLGDELPDEVSREDIQQMLDKADAAWSWITCQKRLSSQCYIITDNDNNDRRVRRV